MAAAADGGRGLAWCASSLRRCWNSRCRLIINPVTLVLVAGVPALDNGIKAAVMIGAHRLPGVFEARESLSALSGAESSGSF